VDRIEGARSTVQTFTPRYAVELTPSGTLSIPSTTQNAAESTFSVAPPRLSDPRTSGSRSKSVFAKSGPTYIYQCGMCGKKFRRSRMNSKIGKHKGHGGFSRPGRTGILVETKY
jgi:hypothetical protein